MHSQSINFLLDIPELNVTQVHKDDNGAILLDVEPTVHIQSCPYCQSKKVIRRGRGYTRKVRHLPTFEKPIFLCLPAIRMSCKDCDASFVWRYDCVEPGERYTKAVKEAILTQVMGATVAHAVTTLTIPYTTVERFYKEWMDKECPTLRKSCIEDALNRDGLVLGIDDFAIRKGHRYNTGIHDLRGGRLLDIIPGRTLEDLRSYFKEHEELAQLKPTAVVMDLARNYHHFVKEMYPCAIRIADRFHVNRYVTEALQTIRKQVQSTLSTHASKRLKQSFRLLSKRADSLQKSETELLTKLLQYSPLLKKAYQWKEDFINWYDLSLNATQASTTLNRWCQQGNRIGHPAIDASIKTVKNWEQEIINYHRLRFTNATVEGRNNKIKMLQRRHYFTRNKIRYKQQILLECNTQHFYL
jgi:transposase